MLIGMIQEWREEAALKALTLREAYAYGLLRDASGRDAYCAERWNA